MPCKVCVKQHESFIRLVFTNLSFIKNNVFTFDIFYILATAYKKLTHRFISDP